MLRVYRFLKTNVFYALLPLGIVFFVHSLTGTPAPLSTYAPEFLFLSVLVGITTLDDLNEEAQHFKFLFVDPIRLVLQGLLFFSLILYGIQTYSQLRNPTDTEFLHTTTIVASVLSVMLCCIGIGTEILIARSELLRSKGATP